MTSGTNQEISLGEAASQYLAKLSEEKRNRSQASLHSFVRWCGWDKPVNSIRGAEAGNYAERLSQADNEAAKKLEIIRGFFSYALKEGWIKENLSLSLRVKKTRAKTNGVMRKVVREPIPLTQTMYDSLSEEVKTLKKQRLDVIKDVQVAAADKDFKENAPYHAAREKKGMIEGKIMEIEETLARAVITEENQELSHLVCVGDTIVLKVEETGIEMRYTLCNPKEVAPAKGKISIASPVGKASLGKKEGDAIAVKAPAGDIKYIIAQVLK